MKTKELRRKTKSDLNKYLLNKLREQFYLRFQFHNKRLYKKHLLKKNRRCILIIKTLLTEKKRDINVKL